MPNIQNINIGGCENLVQIHSSSVPINLECLDFNDCHKLRYVDLGSNVHQGSLKTIVGVYIYFDLKKMTFTKVTISFSLYDDGRICRICFKAESVPFRVFSDGQSLSSLLPFVGKLRCLNIPSPTKFEGLSSHYSLHLQHNYDHGVPILKKEVTTLILLDRTSILSMDETGFVEKCMKGTEREVNMGLRPENSTDLDGEYCICGSISMSKVPKNITSWSLLTELSFQESDIVRVQENRVIPGLSSLKSLVESHCSSLPPIIDVTFSMDEFPSICDIHFSQDLNQSDSYITRIGNFNGGWFSFIIVKAD